MTKTRTLAEAPEPFRAQLHARLAAPTLLDPRAIDSVLALPFRALSDGESVASYFGDAEGAYTVGDNGVAVVSIDGPIAQRAWACWMFGGDGYDAIESRVRAALADERVRALVLRIDSPGGEVAGCGVCADAIRAAADASGKPVVAYADELAASAAYWLASAANQIVVPPSGIVGSVGVITARVEDTAPPGRKVTLITSGKRKADGHPMTALTPEELAATQAKIDALADLFAGAVAKRRGKSPVHFRGLEADVFVGAGAVTAGLADQVTDLTGAIALAASLATTATPTTGQPMKTLLTTMGLSASASEAEAVEKYNELKAQNTRLLGLCEAQGPDEAAAKIAAMKADAATGAKAREDLGALRTEIARRERAAVLDGAVASALMSPAERAEYDANPALASVPAAAIAAAIKHRAPMVPTEKSTSSTTSTGSTSLSDAERELCAVSGVSEAEYIKARGSRAEV